MLSNPCEGLSNDGLDNVDHNLILRQNDALICRDKKYIVLDLLGTGTFGQVFKCRDDSTGNILAVKVIKNRPAYYQQGLLEVTIVSSLNRMELNDNSKHIVSILDSFEYQNHLCIVFELLGISLLDILTQNQFRCLPLSTVQVFARQIVHALCALEDANIIHCDLKPENILLAGPTDAATISNMLQSNVGNTKSVGTASGHMVKLIDFGSACFEGKTSYSYIQSRFCKYIRRIY
jgi:dual specificity protein kinase YAK1